MREIKFRFWDKIDKKMLYDYTLEEANINLAKIEPLNEYEIMMQYTGLKDKNGKEIYEGDILHSDKSELEHVYIIEWSNKDDYCGFVTVSKKYGLRTFLNKDFKNSEVIGNIYENPELTKDK